MNYHTNNFLQEHAGEKLHPLCGQPRCGFFSAAMLVVPLFANPTGLEELCDFRMVAFQRPAQSRRIELLVTQREVCAVDNQKLHHRLVTTDGGPVQARSAEEATAIDVSAFLQQKLCRLNVAVARGNVQSFRNELLIAFRRRRFAPLAIAYSFLTFSVSVAAMLQPAQGIVRRDSGDRLSDSRVESFSGTSFQTP